MVCYVVVLPTSGECHSVKELSFTEDEEAMVFLEAVAWLKVTVLVGKVTCVNVAFVPARPAQRVLSSGNFWGTRCKN